MHIKIILAVAILGFAETTIWCADFFQYAKVQPDTHPKILDLHYDDVNKNATVACVGISQNFKRYICFYDPEHVRVMQTIVFEVPIKACLHLGGSFSEDGRFFTIGYDQELFKPQFFCIYQIARISREQELAGIYPVVVSKLISGYEGDRSYLLFKTAECMPSGPVPLIDIMRN